MNKSRNSNIEILRIISIIMIIISHYTVHNGVQNYTLPIGFNRFFLEVSTLGNIGTIIFVLITGFYLYKSENIKLNKLIKLYLQILFYSGFIYLILVVFNLETFSIKNLIKAIFPITFKEYWFASVYILLYIFHPFINKFLNALNKKEFFKFLLTSIFIFSILSTITIFSTITVANYYANELIQFILFYSMGAYIGKYNKNVFNNKKLNKIILLISVLILCFSVVFFDLISPKISFFMISTYFFNRTSIVSITLAFSLFNFFINKKEKNNVFINSISALVFGVYLISDNNYIRNILWSNIFHNANYVNSNLLIPHMIISVSITFIICIIIEYIRKCTIEKFYIKYVSNYIDKLQVKIEICFNNFFGKFK